MTRSGQAFALPMLEPPTAENGSSSSPSGPEPSSSLKLLPTPTASDSHGGQDAHKRQAAGHQLGLNDVVVTCFAANSSSVGAVRWSAYAEALRRWETKIGRAAPPPVELGRRNQARLSARFVEWLMGLPAGRITGLGLPYSAELRALGNGVVPQQAERALSALLERISFD